MGPFIRSNNSITKIIIRLFISLLPIIIYATYIYGFNLLINIIISSLIILILESVFLKKENKLSLILKGIIISLMFPIDIPKFILITASIIISIIDITFKKNNKIKINSILIVYLISILIFGSRLLKYNTSISGIDANFLNFINGNLSLNIDIFIILYFISFLYLMITKTIKWKISISYIITIFIINFVIGRMLNQNIYFSLYHILNGGIIFSAIYLLTDYKTTSITTIGQVSQGILIAIVTVFLRYIGMEYIVTSVIISNLLVDFLDNIGIKSKTNLTVLLKWFVIIWLLIIMEILGFAIVNKNNPKFNNMIIQKSLT